jgi:hypothetical protein
MRVPSEEALRAPTSAMAGPAEQGRSAHGPEQGGASDEVHQGFGIVRIAKAQEPRFGGSCGLEFSFDNAGGACFIILDAGVACHFGQRGERVLRGAVFAHEPVERRHADPAGAQEAKPRLNRSSSVVGGSGG